VAERWARSDENLGYHCEHEHLVLILGQWVGSLVLTCLWCSMLSCNWWENKNLTLQLHHNSENAYKKIWCFVLGYYAEGFLSLQHLLHKAVIEQLNSSTAPLLDKYTVRMERFPYPPYIDNAFLIVIQQQLPFFLILSMIFIALNIPKEIVLEKERKLKVLTNTIIIPYAVKYWFPIFKLVNPWDSRMAQWLEQ